MATLSPVPLEEVVALVRDASHRISSPRPSIGRVGAHYADTNFHLLGAVLEAVTGERIAHLFDAFLFAPLGMADTSSFPHPPRSGASPEPRRGGLVEGRGIADQWGFGHAEGERRNRLDSHRPTPLHVGSRRR